MKEIFKAKTTESVNSRFLCRATKPGKQVMFDWFCCVTLNPRISFIYASLCKYCTFFYVQYMNKFVHEKILCRLDVYFRVSQTIISCAHRFRFHHHPPAMMTMVTMLFSVVVVLFRCTTHTHAVYACPGWLDRYIADLAIRANLGQAKSIEKRWKSLAHQRER